MQIKQDEVLDAVARPVIEDVLNGVNGTIFAYGQTGSGKTFTITGGAERYEDRGLIPRTLRTMFEAFRKGPKQYRMYISYLEIYQVRSRCFGSLNGFRMLATIFFEMTLPLLECICSWDRMGSYGFLQSQLYC